MLLSYLKISIRKLFKFKRDRSSIYSWINLGGLTIGLTAFLLIGHFVNYELGFDRFCPNHRNIYRLTVERLESGEITMNSAKTYAGIGNILIEWLIFIVFVMSGALKTARSQISFDMVGLLFSGLAIICLLAAISRDKIFRDAATLTAKEG